VKTITICLQNHIHFRFKNKCIFYDLSMEDILTECIIRFNNGELDVLLDLPVDTFLEK